MAVQYIKDKHTDQYLTNFIQRYRCDDDCSEFIAPSFKVKRPSDKYLIYGKENFRVYDNKLVRREPMKEIDVQADDGTYSCEEYGLAGFVYERDQSNVDQPIKLMEEKTQHVKDRMIAARQYRVFAIATNTSLINSTAIAATWATAAGTPVADVLDAMIRIKNDICQPANAIVMNYEVALTLIRTTEWKDYFQYTWGLKPSGDGLWDAVQGFRHIGLDVRLCDGRGVNTYEGCASDPTWETFLDDKVLVFRREPSPTTQSNCFMYSPMLYKDKVRKFWKDEERGWKVTVEEDIDELLVNADAAELLTNVI